VRWSLLMLSTAPRLAPALGVAAYAFAVGG